MSVQLREPCVRLIRHLSLPRKPWPTLLTPRKKLFSQGTSLHEHTTLLIPRPWSSKVSTRSYTTTAALRVLTEDPAIVETNILKHNSTKSTCKLKNKRKITRLWTEYQTAFSESQHTLDVKQYDELISALLEKASSSKKPGFWGRIIQAYEDSQTLNIQPSQNMYLAAIKAYGRSRDLPKVTAIFKEYKQHYKLKATSYDYYLTAVVQCGDANAAHRVFRDINTNALMKKTQLSICLADLVTLCFRKSNPLLAFKSIEIFQSSTWDDDALDRTVQTLWNGLASTPSTSITPSSVESFVRMYIEKSSTSTDKLFIPSHLFTLFHLLCQNNVSPTIATCNLVLDFTDTHLGKVKSVLKSMQRLDITPNEQTLDILNRIFGVKKTEVDVYNYFLNTTFEKERIGKEEVKRLKLGKEEKVLSRLYSSNCTDLDCYAAVLESWIEGGQWNKCAVEYRKLKELMPQVNTNRRIVKAMVTAKLAEGSEWNQISDILKGLKIQFTSTTIMRILYTMMNAESKYGHSLIEGKVIFKSLQVMETVLDLQIDGEGIGRIISRLGKRGDVENGYRIYNWVRGSSQSTTRCSSSSIYLAMMSSAIKNNDIRRLERAWVDMQYRKRFLIGCQDEPKEMHSLSIYNILLNGYASRLPRPDLTRTKRLFHRMLRQNMAPDVVTYNILIKAFVNANNMDAANQIFRKMIQTGTKPDTYTTNTILNGWIIKKDWSHVESLVQELKSSESNACSNLDIVTFNLIVQSFLQLDSKSMNYAHLLKHQNRWSHIQQLEENDAHKYKTKLPSGKIWTIFESTTGFSEKLIRDSNYKSERLQPSQNAFVRLFSNTAEADHVTYKLFMKAFVNIGDVKSAFKVYQWMQYRLRLK
ncbi:unnamed protein product [Mucor hiemalis]